MAKQFFVIFGCLALGEVVVWATGIKLPSSIIGMLLLTFFLKTKIVIPHEYHLFVDNSGANDQSY